MNYSTISPKYQIVIPKQIRNSLKLKPGQKVQMIAYAGRIELVPVIPIEKARGIFSGMESSIERDEEERL